MLNTRAELFIRFFTALLLGVLAQLAGAGPLLIALANFLGAWIVGGIICAIVDVYENRKDSKKFQFEQFLKECHRVKD